MSSEGIGINIDPAKLSTADLLTLDAALEQGIARAKDDLKRLMDYRDWLKAEAEKRMSEKQ